MNYDAYTVDELEEMLDDVVDDYRQGYIHHSLYTIEFNELYEEINSRRRVQAEEKDPNKAYERSMVGI